MPSSTSAPRPLPHQRNLLLAALPHDDYKRILPMLEPTELKRQAVLQDQDEPVLHVHFPTRGLVSLVTVMEDGARVELMTVGREGAVGLSPLIGGTIAPCEAIVQIAGEGHRMPVAAFRTERERRGAFDDLMARYAVWAVESISQSVACNALHSVEQRLARWLLTSRDRLESNELDLTQDLLATMLGVRRPTVTIGVGTFRTAGLIRLSHRHISIIDGVALQEIACECYPRLQQTFRRLLPELDSRADPIAYTV
jgi:CRP-like cAMP-binding protein